MDPLSESEIPSDISIENMKHWLNKGIWFEIIFFPPWNSVKISYSLFKSYMKLWKVTFFS